MCKKSSFLCIARSLQTT